MVSWVVEGDEGEEDGWEVWSAMDAGVKENWKSLRFWEGRKVWYAETI